MAWVSRGGKSISDVPSGVALLQWDIEAERMDSLRGTDHFVYLAGFPLVEGRLDDTHKRVCHASRVLGARLCAKAIASDCSDTLKSFVGASAIGFYGWDRSFDAAAALESDAPGNDWAASLCAAWEKEYANVKSARNVVVRIPPVLSKRGGAYPQMAFPASMGAAATLGSGQQIFPWIHEEDMAAALESAIFSPAWQGVINTVCPEAEQPSAQEFTSALCKSLNRPYLLPNIPEFAARIMFGGVADFVLKGSRISSRKLESLGFQFKYPTLESALAQIAQQK